MKNIRYIEPKIRIGDCREGNRTVLQDDVITVWLDTLYLDDAHIFNFISPLSFTKISNHQYEVTCDVVGWHELRIEVINKDKLQVLRSNSLLIIVL